MPEGVSGGKWRKFGSGCSVAFLQWTIPAIADIDDDEEIFYRQQLPDIGIQPVLKATAPPLNVSGHFVVSAADKVAEITLLDELAVLEALQDGFTYEFRLTQGTAAIAPVVGEIPVLELHVVNETGGDNVTLSGIVWDVWITECKPTEQTATEVDVSPA